MSKRSPGQKQNTRLAHAGREPQCFHGFVNPPIYRGSTILFPTTSALKANEQEYTYRRLGTPTVRAIDRSEEHTSELQSLRHLVCRLLLEKKKKKQKKTQTT